MVLESNKNKKFKIIQFQIIISKQGLTYSIERLLIKESMNNFLRNPYFNAKVCTINAKKIHDHIASCLLSK